MDTALLIKRRSAPLVTTQFHIAAWQMEIRIRPVDGPRVIFQTGNF